MTRLPDQPERAAAEGEPRRATPESPPGIPRWVLFVAAALLVIGLAFAFLVLIGGHDPSTFRH